MNSPTWALIWGIWRRNLWAFVGLLLFLLAGIAVAQVDRFLIKRAIAIDASLERLAGWTIKAADLLPASPEGYVPSMVEFRVGTNVVLRKEWNSRDYVTWSGVSGRSEYGVLSERRGAAIWEGSSTNTVFYGRAGTPLQQMPLTLLAGPNDALAGAVELAAWFRPVACQICAMLAACSFLVVLAIFGCAEAHPKLGFTGLPPRQYCLPLKTSSLVLTPLVSAAVVAFALTLLWYRFAFYYPMGEASLPGLPPHLQTGEIVPFTAVREFGIPVVYYSGLVLGGLAWFQCLVWGLPAFPKTRATLLTMCVLIVTLLASWPYFGGKVFNNGAWDRYVQAIPRFGLAFYAFAGLAWFLSFLAVRKDRCGRWSGLQRSHALPQSESGMVRGGRTPVWIAQTVVEFRRNAWTVAWIWLVSCILMTILCVWDLIGPVFFVAMLGITALGGLLTARDPSSRQLPLSSFTATRPVKTGALLLPKFMAAFLLWVLLVALCGAVMAVLIENNQFSAPGPFELTALLWVSLQVFLGLLPLNLWGRFPGFPWNLLPLILLGTGAVWVTQWVDRLRIDTIIIAGFFGLLAIVRLVLAAWAARRALLQRLISPTSVIGYALFWIIATNVLIYFADQYGDSISRSDQIVYAIGAFSVVPVLRIALTPLALAHNRHR